MSTTTEDDEAPVPVVAMDDRIAERRAAVRAADRRRRLRRTVTVLAAAILAFGALLIDRSDLVGLAEILVEGESRHSAAAIRRASGLTLGTSTARLDLAAAEDAVETLPFVREADAVRVDPLTVSIRVTEREPLFRTFGGGAPRVVDADGVILGVPCDTCGDDALLQVRIDVPADAIGARAEDVHPPLAGAIVAWFGLPGPIRAEVVAIEAPSDLQELRLVLDGGTEVLIGRATERLDEKGRALGAVLEQLDGRAVRVIDVRAPRAPAVIE